MLYLTAGPLRSMGVIALSLRIKKTLYTDMHMLPLCRFSCSTETVCQSITVQIHLFKQDLKKTQIDFSLSHLT